MLLRLPGAATFAHVLGMNIFAKFEEFVFVSTLPTVTKLGHCLTLYSSVTMQMQESCWHLFHVIS
jgi:hypothetical protein